MSAEIVEKSVQFVLREVPVSAESFLAQVQRGLRSAPKTLPCKFFYDARGSRLFDEICELEEYYPTRTELGILVEHARSMADAVGPGALMVELGSGSGNKTRTMLDALIEPAGYVPVDIARGALLAAAAQLVDAYPGLEVAPVCADYTRPFPIPLMPREARSVLFFFPGSTIGNLGHDEAVALLANLRRHVSGRCALLLGADLKKDRRVLEQAYDDARGVTAAFNLHLLERINAELGADFDLSRFVHRARWDERPGRVEMQLVSRVAQTVTLAGESFAFAEGEAIVTEHSHKYDVDQIRQMGDRAGFALDRVWTDPAHHFALVLLRGR